MKFNRKLKTSIAGILILGGLLTACGSPNSNVNTGENTAEGTDGADTLGSIVVVSRENGSGTRDAFVEITKVLEKTDSGEEDKTSGEALIQNSTNAVMTTVAGNKDGIGYISMGSLNDSIKAIKIESVDPTAENILNKSYQISRPFILVNKEKDPLVEDFLAFCNSEEGQSIVEENSYVRLDSQGNYEAKDLSGDFTIAGSTSVTPLIEKLVEKYKELNPDVTIEIQSPGSSAGIQAVVEGTAQLGMSSRDLKEEEKVLEEHVLAMDGIAVIVNKENPIESLTMDQVQKIFTGEITGWDELEG